MQLFDREIFSVVWTRWLKAIFVLRIALSGISIFYAVQYFMHPARPGNNPRFPLGWWDWFDQGKYILSADAIAHLDFSREKHFYPPLYPVPSGLFERWWVSHPFWLVDLVSLLWFSAVFILLARRYVPRWATIVLLLLSVLFYYTIFENFLIPWTSTVSAALLSTGVYGLLRLRDAAGEQGTSVTYPTAFASFGISLAIGLIALLQPAVAISWGVYCGSTICEEFAEFHTSKTQSGRWSRQRQRFFTRYQQLPYRFICGLLMNLTPIQIFPVQHVIEHVYATLFCKASRTITPIDSFCNHTYSNSAYITSGIGSPEPLLKPARTSRVFMLPCRQRSAKRLSSKRLPVCKRSTVNAGSEVIFVV